MTTQSRISQRIGGLGIAFTVLFAGTFVLIGSQPSAGSSGAAVVKYYHAHRVAQTAAVFFIAAAVVAFTFFLSSLRQTLGNTTESRLWGQIVTAGGAVYVSGLLLSGALTIALVDASHHGMTTAAQTLNVLSSDDWVPVVVGLSIVTLGTGIGALRGAALPRWLAWASVGLGVLAIAGPLGGLAFLITPLWTLAAGIVLLRRAPVDPYPDATPTTAAASVPSNR